MNSNENTRALMRRTLLGRMSTAARTARWRPMAVAACAHSCKVCAAACQQMTAA